MLIDLQATMPENDHFDHEPGSHAPVPPDVVHTLAELFGIKVRFAPDSLAPPVDSEKLAKYLNDELSPGEVEEVCHLIGTFRSWYLACGAILRRKLDE
jgi:hypothetical protein